MPPAGSRIEAYQCLESASGIRVLITPLKRG